METFGIVPPPVRSNVFEDSTIDQMHSRGLATETALNKLARRRFATPQEILRQICWHIARLGFTGWLRCLARSGVESFRRKFFRRRAGAGGADRLRVPLNRN